MKKYKFLRTGYKSEYGDHKWVVGKWCELEDEPELCKKGFHCSNSIWHAFSYVQGEILCEVEVDGESSISDDKESWQKMRVVKSYKWTKKDLVLFAIFAARLVLKNFEDVYPNDDRPKKVIEAAEKYVKNPTKKNARAAEAAARAEIYTQYDKWMLKHLKELKVLKEVK